MAALVVVAAALSYVERWRRYERLAAYHLNEATAGAMSHFRATGGQGYWWMDGNEAAHAEKSEEYERAAPYPWIFVNPDLVRPGESTE